MINQLLNKALSIIKPTPVVYRKYLGQITNENRIKVPSYAAPITITQAIVQPVSTQIFQMLGLDMQREYRRVFISTNAVALEGQLSSDKFEFYGNTWTAWGNTAWHSYDGWNELIVIGEKTR